MIPSHLQGRTLEQLRSTQETIRCFSVVPTGDGYTSITVWEDSPEGKPCVGGFDYHRSEYIVERYPLGPHGEYPEGYPTEDEKRAKTPKYCFRCGNFEFSEERRSQSSWGKGRTWENQMTGERADNLNAFGPGAMWYLTWYEIRDKDTNTHLGYSHPGFEKTFDHPALCVRTPGGEWVIDSRASNCGNPSDNDHKCWPRHGEAPLVTVDKSFGITCGTGGGSIVAGSGEHQYHGFLRDGFLIKC